IRGHSKFRGSSAPNRKNLFAKSGGHMHGGGVVGNHIVSILENFPRGVQITLIHHINTPVTQEFFDNAGILQLGFSSQQYQRQRKMTKMLYNFLSRHFFGMVSAPDPISDISFSFQWVLGVTVKVVQTFTIVQYSQWFERFQVSVNQMSGFFHPVATKINQDPFFDISFVEADRR